MLTPWVGREAEEFADGLSGRPLDDAELAELVDFAGELERAATVQPSDEFSTGLRESLMAEAATVLVREPVAVAPRPARAPSPRRRRLTAAITSVVVAGGGISLAASSASALPGDMLYPIKRSLESAQTVLHRSDSGRATYDLQRASERLSETTELVHRDAVAAEIVASTLEDFTALTQRGTTRAFDQSPTDQPTLEHIAEFAEQSAAGLSSLGDLVPEGASGAHAEAIAAVTALKGRLDVLCQTCDSVSSDALDDLRSSVEQAARDAPDPQVPEEDSPEDPRSDRTSDGAGQGSDPAERERDRTDPGHSSQPSPDPRPDLPGSDSPPSEGSSGAGGGLLDTVTRILTGDPEDPKLLGGLLGR